jgi:CheY-like chemotaxis protein
MDDYEATASQEIGRGEREALRAGRPRTRLQIIATTANARQGDREQCHAAAMNDYVGKPVRAEDLLAPLARWQQAVG